MGAGQSGGIEIGGSSLGYQVLRVYPNSPGSRAGLKAYFDFIVAIGDTRFNKEDGSLREILKASVDQKLKMIVFNTRNKMAREVEIIPTTSWGGSGLLGVSIKHSSFDKADERVWHVVEVDPGSPASQAGFKAGEDYVIGSDSILQENDDLYNLIEAHEAKALKLFVYNVKTDNCREVICHPNSKWGGRGYLGCEFGHGLLHRIPYTDDQASGGDSRPPASSMPAPIQTQQQTNGTDVPGTQPPVQSQQQLPHSFAQMPTQPGHQLFQQALFNQNPIRPPQQQQQQQQQQQPQQPINEPPHILPQPPPAPKTFAQLASAQFQTQQSPPPPLQLPHQQPHHQPRMIQSDSCNAPVPTAPETNHYQAAQQPSFYMQSYAEPSSNQDYNISQQALPSYQLQPGAQNQGNVQVSNVSDLSSPPPLPPPLFSSGSANQPRFYPPPQNQIDQTPQSVQEQQYYSYQQ